MKDIEKLTIKELCDLKYNDKNLMIPLGWTINDKEPYYKNFKRISGLFIAGATGTGKSIFIDDLIVSLMYKNTSSEVKFLMFDPKKIELGEYNGITYIIDGKSNYNLKRSVDLLICTLKILDIRLHTLNKCGYKSIEEYNKNFDIKWPHIFIFVDEGSKLIQENEAYEVFSKVLDYGNKVGIHLIYATNSYLKDYVNSKFLDKFKYRITFDLTSIEQAKFIDIKNSSWLNGNGEAFIRGRSGEIYKIQAPYVKDDEIERIVSENKNEN